MDLTRLLDSQQACISHLETIKINVKKLPTQDRNEKKLGPIAANAASMWGKIKENHEKLLRLAGLPEEYHEKYFIASQLFNKIKNFIKEYAPSLVESWEEIALTPVVPPTTLPEITIQQPTPAMTTTESVFDFLQPTTVVATIASTTTHLSQMTDSPITTISAMTVGTTTTNATPTSTISASTFETINTTSAPITNIIYSPYATVMSTSTEPPAASTNTENSMFQQNPEPRHAVRNYGEVPPTTSESNESQDVRNRQRMPPQSLSQNFPMPGMTQHTIRII